MPPLLAPFGVRIPWCQAQVAAGILILGSLVAISGVAHAAPAGLTAAPLAPRSGPRGITLFTDIPPAVSGLKAANTYDDPRMWAFDKIHMSGLGHKRMAAFVLRALDVPHTLKLPDLDPWRPRGWVTATREELAFVRSEVVPLVKRRIRGVYDGDTAQPKWPTPIRPADIATRFGVSRSSAYRWAYSLEQARLLAQTMEIPRGAGHRTPVQADTEARAQ